MRPEVRLNLRDAPSYGARMPGPGDRVGRYELVACLGRGGMGEVWEAVLHGPGGFRKAVALKLLVRGGEPQHQRALVEEARWGALCSHPNIAATFELGDDDGRWFIAMELVRGLSVGALVRNAPMPGAAVLEVGLQTCGALAHLHAVGVDGPGGAGLVHGDVTPRNLLVDRSGLVKLVDLGIARLAGPVGAAWGTPGFVAPEQWVGAAEARSDLFSLGAVLYHLASGRFAFDRGAKGPTRALVDERLADPGFLRPIGEAVPGLAEVIARCLQSAPEDRWADASELAAALRSLRARYPDDDPLLPLVRSPDRDTTPTPSVRRSSGSLPSGRDAFVGRAAEREELEGRIARGDRLVTVLGPGGIGKTRLVVEALRAGSLAIPGGAWWTAVGAVGSIDEVCRKVADVLGMSLGAADPLGRLGAALRARGRTVLVLDDVDRCTALAATAAEQWTALAPELTVVVVSRVAPRIPGDEPLVVGPLDEADAVELLQLRIGRSDDPEVILELVRRLDGLPLAIELAARRGRIVGAGDVLARLDDRFALLASSEHGRPERHRSLQASLDLSWSMLPAGGQAALVQLSVLVGSFDLEAADAVLDLRGTDLRCALDAIELLVDHSLLRVDRDRGRFSMLGVVHEYAALRGRDAGAGVRQAELRHGWHFAAHGARELLGRGWPGERIRADLPDLVAACRRAVAAGNLPVAVRTGLAAATAFRDDGPYAIGLELCDMVLGLRLPDRDRIELLILRCTIAIPAGRLDEAHADAVQLSALADAAGDRRAKGIALCRLGAIARGLGRPDKGLALFERALAIFEKTGNAALVADTLGRIGTCASQLGRTYEAAAWYRRALAGLDDPRTIGLYSGNLANALLMLGRADEALPWIERAEASADRFGDNESMAYCAGHRAVHAFTIGALPQACAEFERALALFRGLGDGRREAVALGGLGIARFGLGRVGEGVGLVERAAAMQRVLGNVRDEAGELRNLASICTDIGRLDEAERALDEAERLLVGQGDDRTRALAEMIRGMLVHARGDRHAAKRVLEPAEHAFLGLRDNRRVATVRYQLARVAAALGRPDDASEALSAAEEAADGITDPAFRVRLAVGRAWLRLGAGDPRGAEEAVGMAASVLHEVPWLFWEEVLLDRVRTAIDATLGRTAEALARSAGVDVRLAGAEGAVVSAWP